jgi:hypothetical protein
LKPKCPGMIIGRSSKTFGFFMPIRNPTWLPPQVIVLTQGHMGKYRNIFLSEAIALIEPKLCINHWKVLLKLCIFYVDRNSKMTTTAGHSFYIGPIGCFYIQVNDTGSWEPLVMYLSLIGTRALIDCRGLLGTYMNQCTVWITLISTFWSWFHYKWWIYRISLVFLQTTPSCLRSVYQGGCLPLSVRQRIPIYNFHKCDLQDRDVVCGL